MRTGEIPLLDLRDSSPAALADMRPESTMRLIAAGRKLLSPPALAAMDRASRRWAYRTENPYRHEIAAVAARIPVTGVWFMNLCFEWGCTSGLVAESDAALAGAGRARPRSGVRLLRTLDWPFHGLGREAVVVRQSAPAGAFYNVTWPGFVGVVTAMAPGRFSIALNQAPLLSRGPWPIAVDWLLERYRVSRSRDLPPMHLARRVIETCRTFEEAVEQVESTPVAMPAFFTLAGSAPGQGVIVERTPAAAYRHSMPIAVANAWLTPGLGGRERGLDNAARRALMDAHCRGAATAGPLCDFDWVVPPVLNSTTRLAVAASAATGGLAVRGYEVDGPVTETFELPAQSVAA